MSDRSGDPDSHPYLAQLEQRLRARAARAVLDPPGTRRAAVALIHRPVAGGAELLLVKRAEYPGDPWSGHIALPGGRSEEGETPEETAVRETLEETAIDLNVHGRLLGTLDDVYPANPLLPPLVITPFIAAVGARVEVRLSPELAESFWVPVTALQDPAARLEVELEVAGRSLRVPSFRHAGHTVWGITQRILDQYLGIIRAD